MTRVEVNNVTKEQCWTDDLQGAYSTTSKHTPKKANLDSLVCQIDWLASHQQLLTQLRALQYPPPIYQHPGLGVMANTCTSSVVLIKSGHMLYGLTEHDAKDNLNQKFFFHVQAVYPLFEKSLCTYVLEKNFNTSHNYAHTSIAMTSPLWYCNDITMMKALQYHCNVHISFLCCKH